MSFWRDPRVLDDDWSPTTLVGRDALLEDLTGLLPSRHERGGPVGLLLWGSRGVGTSVVARHAARAFFDRWKDLTARRTPLLLRADAAGERTPSRIACALFRGVDERFDGRGCSTELLALLLLRRLRTLGLPAVLWIDQVRATSSGLPRLLGPLLCPERFLPEGAEGLPPFVVIVSGEVDPLEGTTVEPYLEGGRVRREHLLALAPRDVLAETERRARLAFDVPPEREVLTAVSDLLLTKGWGLSLVGATLKESGRRAEARGARRLERRDIAPPADPLHPRRNSRALDACILESLREGSSTTERGGLTLPELRRRLEERCRLEGLGMPSDSRLWRHTVRLERSGAFRREVHLGGTGGSSVHFWVGTRELPGELPDRPSPPAEPGGCPSPLAPSGPQGPGPVPRAASPPFGAGTSRVPSVPTTTPIPRSALSTRRAGPTGVGFPRGMTGWGSGPSEANEGTPPRQLPAPPT